MIEVWGENECFSFRPGVLHASYNFNQDATRIGSMEDRDRFELIKRQVEEVHGLPRKHLDDVVINYKTIHCNPEVSFRVGLAYYSKIHKRYNL